MFETDKTKKALEWFVNLSLERQLEVLDTVKKREKLEESVRDYISIIFDETIRAFRIDARSEEDICRELVTKGFHEAVAHHLIELTAMIAPTIREDAESLKEFSIDELKELSQAIVDMALTGHTEITFFNELDRKKQEAVYRMIINPVSTILRGADTFDEAKKRLIERFEYSEEMTQAIYEIPEKNITRLREVMLFSYLYALASNTTKIRDSLSKLYSEMYSLIETIKRSRGEPSEYIR